jgi:NAD(P)-dependent dehydrogenase (short-subunit alcohol dehydrogenase family)
MACRNRAKGEEAAQQLVASYPAAAGRLHVVDCDLEDLPSVKHAANKVRVVVREVVGCTSALPNHKGP